eukprot:1185291-Prorocentrum_minimum.AAC.5
MLLWDLITRKASVVGFCPREKDTPVNTFLCKCTIPTYYIAQSSNTLADVYTLTRRLSAPLQAPDGGTIALDWRSNEQASHMLQKREGMVYRVWDFKWLSVKSCQQAFHICAAVAHPESDDDSLSGDTPTVIVLHGLTGGTCEHAQLNVSRFVGLLRAIYIRCDYLYIHGGKSCTSTTSARIGSRDVSCFVPTDVTEMPPHVRIASQPAVRWLLKMAEGNEWRAVLLNSRG